MRGRFSCPWHRVSRDRRQQGCATLRVPARRKPGFRGPRTWTSWALRACQKALCRAWPPCGCECTHSRTNQASPPFPCVPAVRASCPRMWPLTLSRFLPLLFFSNPRLPVEACLGLETLREGEVSSVASEGNPARMQPTKTHSARPAGASDLQLPRVS